MKVKMISNSFHDFYEEIVEEFGSVPKEGDICEVMSVGYCDCCGAPVMALEHYPGIGFDLEDFEIVNDSVFIQDDVLTQAFIDANRQHANN